MPTPCCVPRCKGNYKNGPSVHIFGFPKNEERKKKWIHAIKRKHFIPSQYSKVCELHFQKHEILWETKYYDERSGRIVTAPIDKPRLTKEAIPSIFPNCPDYMSSYSVSRESPDVRRSRLEMEAIQKAIDKSKEENEAYFHERKFDSLDELKSKLHLVELNEFWSTIVKNDCILLLNLAIEPHVKVKYSIIINDDLSVSTYAGHIKISKLGNFNFPLYIKSVIELNEILNLIKSVESQEKDYLQMALDLVKDIFIFFKSHLDERCEEKLCFILEQITLVVTKIPYSLETLIFSSLLHYIAPHAYRFLRESDLLTLPHPSTIKRICFPNIDPQNELHTNNNFLRYIKKKVPMLSKNDKKVVLQVDEIHILPNFDFKGGNITGSAIDSEFGARSAHVFMISSFLSKFKDVVHILPVKSLQSEFLNDIMKKIIIGLEEIEFMVIAISTDNNYINRNAVSRFFNPPSLQFVYPHPVNKSRPLFYCIDSVHLFKCIRNNWVNQKNPERCMYYPTFDSNFNEAKDFHTASLDCLKHLYSFESTDLLKFSFNLSHKALYPSSIEKQNVKLVLQIFNEHVAEGLLLQGAKRDIPHYKDTSAFLKIITTWWNIVNVRAPNTGVRLNNVFQFPLKSSDDDPQNIFLTKFIDWLDRWESMECTTGMLSNETHSALKLTTLALLNIALYCNNELGLSYILPGKFQTDQLESRFSKYRQMGGAQYHISMRQIYEIEKKIRTQSLLNLNIKTKSFGEIPISHFVGNMDDTEITSSNTDDYSHITLEITDEDFSSIEDKLPIITYLGGYCAHTVLMKLKCASCKDVFVIDKELVCGLDHALIQGIDRGKLLYPQDITVKLILYNYIVVQKLCSEFETDFLKFSNQRYVAINSTIDVLLDNCVFDPDECCENGHAFQESFKRIIQSSTNTLLNNFCKRKNDAIQREKKNTSGKRKLKALKSS